MRKKIICILFCTLLILAVLPTQGSTFVKILQENEKSNEFLYQNDVLIPPIIKSTGFDRSPAPGYYDLSEYMIGTVAIGMIFLESDGTGDPSTEDWTQNEKDTALGSLGIGGGNAMWNSWFNSENLYKHNLMFYGEVQTINISYEPIIHPTPFTNGYWEEQWVNESMAEIGYTSGDWIRRVRDYNNYLRNTTETIPGYYGTDWAFTVFIIDNSNDADGYFSDGYHAYAYLGGPFTVCPHLRPGGPPGPTLREVFAHELGHIFYATDEYNGNTDYSGYLNAADVEGSGCIMDNLALCISSGSKQQVGWKDSDSDGIADILDTDPDTTLNPYSPDPTSDPTPTYTGSATVVPSQNNNPNGPGNDVTLNTIALVQYRVDGGTWSYDVTPDDGDWDEAVESFSFTTIPLSEGTHTIEARATNSVGNFDSTPGSDTITIVSGNQPPDKPAIPSGPPSGKILVKLTYSSSANDPENEQIYYLFDWGDGSNSGWVGPYNSGQTGSASHIWTSQGTYQVKVKAKDINDNESVWSDSFTVNIPRSRENQFTSLLIIIKNLLTKIPIIRYVLEI
ncbi:MAG: hypothetical protein AYK22_03610 [Thermoplasmatales archaeon SG8-52-3]|nr:MAG: hypothetical protein AYK22_03610 [Thermoplasmatales archaeon SG8-52-3]